MNNDIENRHGVFLILYWSAFPLGALLIAAVGYFYATMDGVSQILNLDGIEQMLQASMLAMLIGSFAIAFMLRKKIIVEMSSDEPMTSTEFANRAQRNMFIYINVADLPIYVLIGLYFSTLDQWMLGLIVVYATFGGLALQPNLRQWYAGAVSRRLIKD